MQKPLSKTAEVGEEQDNQRGDKIFREETKKRENSIPKSHQRPRGCLPSAERHGNWMVKHFSHEGEVFRNPRPLESRKYQLMVNV